MELGFEAEFYVRGVGKAQVETVWAPGIGADSSEGRVYLFKDVVIQVECSFYFLYDDTRS